MDFGLELLMNPKKKPSDSASCNGDEVTGLKMPFIQSMNSMSDVSQITDDESVDDIAQNISNTNFERIEINTMDDDSISTRSGSSGTSLRSKRSYNNENSKYNNYNQQSQRYASRTSSHAPSVRSVKSSRSSDSHSEVSKSDLESLGSVLASAPKKNGEYNQPRLSNEQVIIAKRELLYQFDRLEKKGMKLPKKFTMASSLDEMKCEYERLKRDKDLDNAIRFQRRALMFFTSGVEMLTTKVDTFGVNLDGWSESVHDNIDEYDDTFEELYDKYKGKAKMAPELKLVCALGMSAFTFNMTKSMMKSMPGVEQVFKQNPDLMKQFAAATAKTMQQEQPQGGILGGLGGLFSNLFGGGGANVSNVNGQSMSHQQPTQHDIPQYNQQPIFNMKGPNNIDDLMKDLEQNDNDRIEIMSTVTSSEFTELEDDISINNLMYGKKKKNGKNGGRKITLDI